jgi:hypothetical protein
MKTHLMQDALGLNDQIPSAAAYIGDADGDAQIAAEAGVVFFRFSPFSEEAERY